MSLVDCNHVIENHCVFDYLLPWLDPRLDLLQVA
jgi:hypothetical protein